MASYKKSAFLIIPIIKFFFQSCSILICSSHEVNSSKGIEDESPFKARNCASEPTGLMAMLLHIVMEDICVFIHNPLQMFYACAWTCMGGRGNMLHHDVCMFILLSFTYSLESNISECAQSCIYRALFRWYSEYANIKVRACCNNANLPLVYA